MCIIIMGNTKVRPMDSMDIKPPGLLSINKISPTLLIPDVVASEAHLIQSIMQVESGGNRTAYNKSSGATGCMQIMPVMVAEVNRICKIKKLKKRFTLDDRWSCEYSIEMFLIWKDYHHSTSTPEKISRHWWGGPRYGERECSVFYWKRVRRELKKLYKN